MNDFNSNFDWQFIMGRARTINNTYYVNFERIAIDLIYKYINIEKLRLFNLILRRYYSEKRELYKLEETEGKDKLYETFDDFYIKIIKNPDKKFSYWDLTFDKIDIDYKSLYSYNSVVAIDYLSRLK